MNLLIRRETFAWWKTIVSHRIHDAKKTVDMRMKRFIEKRERKRRCVSKRAETRARGERERERERERRRGRRLAERRWRSSDRTMWTSSYVALEKSRNPPPKKSSLFASLAFASLFFFATDALSFLRRRPSTSPRWTRTTRSRCPSWRRCVATSRRLVYSLPFFFFLFADDGV